MTLRSLLWLLLLMVYVCPAGAQELIELNQGQFHFQSSEAIAESESSITWQPVSLPDNWNKKHPDMGKIGTYRFDWVLEKLPENELLALLLPRVSNNAKIYLNGKLIAQHGEFNSYSLIWNRPYYMTIPTELLRLGSNTLDIKVAVKANYFGRLLPFHIGGDTEIKSAYQTLYFLQVTLSQICAVLAFSMGVFLFFVWRSRKESVYGWFTLASLAWAFYSLYFFVTTLPIPLEYWVRFCFSCHFIMLGAILVYFCQFIGWQHVMRERFILGYAVCAILLLFILPDIHVFHGIRWIVTGYAVMYMILILALLKFLYYDRHNRKAMLGLICVGINLILGFHDWANIFFILNHPYVLQFGQPLIFIMMGHEMLKSYMQALTVSESHNHVLAQRIQESEHALRQSLEKTRQAEHEKILLKERERIMADIHDGVGGHLVSVLAVAEASATKEGHVISETVHQAMDELRIVIDSLDPDEQCLSQMLASFRYRYQPRLDMHGIEVIWDFDQLDQFEYFGLDKALQLLRILQELMTNVIKHAEADKVTVRVFVRPKDENDKTYVLLLADNGKGFDVTHTIGRGLGNLKRRVEAVNGLIEFRSNSLGTTVEAQFL